MNFRDQTDEAAVLSILDAYHASGGSFFQGFGGVDAWREASAPPAYSETVVGRWWHRRGLQRENLVFATRIAISDTAELESPAFRAALRGCCEASLSCFETDYLDLLVCDWNGAGAPPSELRWALDGLIRDGIVRYLAFAGVSAWGVMASLREGRDRNHRRPDALQAGYSLLARTTFERDLVALCREQRLGFLAAMPLAGGILAMPPRDARAAEPGSEAASCSVAQVVAEVADRRRCTSAQVALSWVLHHAGVTSAIVGVAAVEHWQGIAAATDLILEPDELTRLHEASEVQRTRLPPRADEKGPASSLTDLSAATEKPEIA